jgi:vacuolar protein sorting-associated protein 51
MLYEKIKGMARRVKAKRRRTRKSPNLQVLGFPRLAVDKLRTEAYSFHIFPLVLDYSQQNFSPKAYLSTVHKKTSIDSLVSGRVQLEKKVTSRQKQLEFLVKDNFSRFVLCKDALDDVYVRVETERRAEGPANPIDSTEESYSDLITKSKDLFDKLLDRQVEIDKIRNVLSILKRSQFIFNLPRRMRESIERGEFAKVVLNYKKVKSIVASAVHASIKSTHHKQPQTFQR